MNSNDDHEATQVNSKKEVWKFIIQTIISILTAILTALGASSCVHHIIF
ncbi:MAG: smalltalk protein [Bacteroidales bacterium]|nr:smalltalk protein [Bacteroidales bacterium]